jgi:N-acetylglucosaminyldiphosphoundecaprenol N-acetyl-beta-D-mannosaminyltransferase
MKRHFLLGVPVDEVTLPALYDTLFQAIDQRKKALVSHVNVQAINLAQRDPAFRAALSRADVVYCDGVGVKIAANLLARRIPQRLTACDWLEDFSARIGTRGLYFLGGRPEEADKARTLLTMCRFSAQHGYFHKSGPENEKVLSQIRAFAPAVLMVGMGMPLQEKWVQENWSELPACVIMTVGGLLDVYTGRLKRVPRWISDRGGEWLGRLLWQPRHVWKRYLIGNPLFIARVVLSLVS